MELPRAGGDDRLPPMPIVFHDRAPAMKPGPGAGARDRSARVDIPDHAPHILVVDDDRRLRDLLARFLSEHGFRVTTAASAAEARAKTENFVFDALVLDVMMPGETGFDYARSLRQTSQVPILMLTARADAADRVARARDRRGRLPAQALRAARADPAARQRSSSAIRPAPAISTGPPEAIRFGPFTFRFDRGELRRRTRSCASPSGNARS